MIDEEKQVYAFHHIQFFDFTPRPINCLAYNEETAKLAVARFDADGSYIEIWDTNNNWCLEQNMVSVPSVEAMLWHKSRLFSAGFTGDLVEFDLFTGRVKSLVPSNFGPILCMTVNKKDDLIAAGTDDGSIVLYEILSNEVIFKKAISKQQDKILSICWHESTNMIITGGSDVRVWEATTGMMIQKFSVGNPKKDKIWTIAVTEDFTIVAGDSTGNTSFWFGKPGHMTHSKNFPTHGADIHCIQVNDKSNTICVAGIDGLVPFRAIEREVERENTDAHKAVFLPLKERDWANCTKRSLHISDVKAIQFVNSDTVVSAGLDCQLIVNFLAKKKNNKKLQKLPCIQPKGLVYSARTAKCLLFQYARHIELWQVPKVDKKMGSHAAVLPQSSGEKKLFKASAKHSIICSCVSKMAEFVAYSSDMGTFLYYLLILRKPSNDVNSLPQVVAKKVECPPQFSQSSCTHLSISPNGNVLCSITRSKLVMFLDIQKSRSGQSATVISKYRHQENAIIQDISFNSHSDKLAIACSRHGVKLLDVKTGQETHTLPSREFPPFSLDFHPIFPDRLLVSYTDAMIVEISMASNLYTKKCRAWMRNWHKDFVENLLTKQQSTRFRAFYDPSFVSTSIKALKAETDVADQQQERVCNVKGDRILCQHETGFSSIDWSSDLNESSKKRKLGDEDANKSKIINFYSTKNLFHFDILGDRDMVAVQKSSDELMSSFAPVFRKRKFGT